MIVQSLDVPASHEFSDNLMSLSFDEARLSDDDTVLATVRLFLDSKVMEPFHINQLVSFTNMSSFNATKNFVDQLCLDTNPLDSHCEEELPSSTVSQLETCIHCRSKHVHIDHGNMYQ